MWLSKPLLSHKDAQKDAKAFVLLFVPFCGFI